MTDATIVVRRARPGERFTTLDGQDRALDDSMLVIADPARAIGLAGVMGGANTEVGPATTRVLLESAYFAPASIRRTSRALGLRTDAAYRFERGADIEGLVDASARAAQLMAELAGGVVARGHGRRLPDAAASPCACACACRASSACWASRRRATQARRILTGLGLGVRDAAATSTSRCRASGATSRWRTTSSRRSSACGATTGSRPRCVGGPRSRSRACPIACARRAVVRRALVGRRAHRGGRRTASAIPRARRRCAPPGRPEAGGAAEPAEPGRLAAAPASARRRARRRWRPTCGGSRPTCGVFEIGRTYAARAAATPGPRSRAGWRSR